MPIKYTENTIEEFYKLIDSNKVVLPNFQRSFIWKTKQQKSLITSFLIDLPIGSVLHLEGKKDDFAARLIGMNPIVVPADECQYVLDGQQRITTLKNAFYDFYSDQKNWKDTYEKVFENLRNRWFIQLDSGIDVFSLDTLHFEIKKINTLEPNDFIQLVVNKKINISKQYYNNWYHPAYAPTDNDNIPLRLHKKLLNQSRNAAQELLIPLYTISEKEHGLHRKVLQEIAQTRSIELIASVKDGERTLYEVLGHLEPDIETFEESETIKVWSRLEVRWTESVANYLEDLLKKELPIILLPSNEISRAASIFEEINKGGTPLSIFDLIVAKSAKSMKDSLSTIILALIGEQIDVTHINGSITDWNASLVSDITSNIPTAKFQSIYLNLMSIIVFGMHNHQTIDKSLLSKEKILSMTSNDVNDHTESVVRAISRAFAFLQLRCGIQKDSDISYEYMVLPIAYLFYNDSNWNNSSLINGLESWYWCSLFSGTYHVTRPDEQIKNDFDLLLFWLEENDLNKVDEKHKSSKQLVDLHTYKSYLFNRDDYSDLNTLLMKSPNIDKIPKAIQNSIMQYILSLEPRDFLPNESIRLSAYNATKNRDVLTVGTGLKQYKLERHHIIPLGTATSINQSSSEIRGRDKFILNSPLNLTDISENANRAIGAMNVNQYMSELGNTILDHMLASASFYQRITGESDDAFYERCLEERFRILKDTITREIDDLLR